MEFTNKDWEDIKQQVINEFKTSRDATDTKREDFRNREYLYNTKAEDEKVRVNLIRGLTMSLMALYYQDKLSIKWSSRDLYHFIEASNFQSMCEYDYDNLSMEQDDFLNQKNRFTKGVGIRILTGWDDSTKSPDYKVVDPLSWFPDPKGHTSVKYFDYMGFERIMSVDKIKAIQEKGDWRNIEVKPGLTNESESTETEKGDVRDIQKDSIGDNNTVIYFHYTMYKQKPIQVTMWQRNDILDIKVIEPLLDKEGNCLKKFPVALNYFEPLDGDPRGINIYDIAEDKQKLKTLIYNLIRIQAIKQALGGRVFLDRSIYTKSKKLLQKGVMGPQYIPVDSNGGNIGNMLYIEPEKGLSQDVYNFPQLLDGQVEADTGLSKIVRGVADPNATTATEVNTAQMNANINLILGNKINSRGEKDFWELWYLFYKHYFSSKDKKYVELNRGIGQSGDIFSRKDIISGNDPRLVVKNKGELEAKDRMDLQSFTEIYAMTINDPTVMPIAKRFMKRKLFSMQGMSLREIEQACPRTAEELDAKEQVVLLNNNIPIQIMNPDEDHYTYMCIYQSALRTPATKSAIEMRKMAYIQSGQAQVINQMQLQPNPQMSGPTNQMPGQKPGYSGVPLQSF